MSQAVKAGSADRLREGRHHPDEQHMDWEGDPRPLDQLEMQLRCAPIGAQKPVRKVASLERRQLPGDPAARDAQ